jgi:hypothetical protein
LVVLGLLTLSGGCQCVGRDRPRIPKINPHAGADAIAMFDKNGDGKLSGDELDQCPGLKAALPRLDPAKTGAVTAEMIDARVAAWRARPVGRMPMACTVLRRGQPLPGAQVKFVPEKFLGSDIETATGVTGSKGGANMAAPIRHQRGDRPGVAQGFYRVEITKPGLAIPAKYNASTILGVEVCADGPHDMPRFDLDF